VLDRYQIERLIGEGGFGAVYQARHTVTGRRVALKVLMPDDAGADVKTLDRFVQEARAAAAIGSPHIVDVLDAGATEDGKHFLVMEFLDGTDLEHLLEKEGPIAPERAVDLAVQVLEALGAAHAKDIVHRDLKPGNIFITKRNGREFVKLLDFGISKMIVPERIENLTKAGIVLGTPHYMAPEQLMASHEVDGRADVWAMATVLYEMVADRRPFEAATVQELFLRVHTEPPTPLAAIAKSVPLPLAQVIERGLARDRDARWGSAAIMADALKRVMRGDLSVLSSGGSTLPAMNTPMPGQDKKLAGTWNSAFPVTRDSSTPSPFAQLARDRPTAVPSNRPGPRSDRPNAGAAPASGPISGPISQPIGYASPPAPAAYSSAIAPSSPGHAGPATPGAYASPIAPSSPGHASPATPGAYANPIAPSNPGMYPSQPGAYAQPVAMAPGAYPSASAAYATPGPSAFAPAIASQPYAPSPQSGAHPVGHTPSLGGFGANPYASGQTAALPSQYPSRPGPLSSPSQPVALAPGASGVRPGAGQKSGLSAAAYFAFGVLAVMLAVGAGGAVWIALAATSEPEEVATSEVAGRDRAPDQPSIAPVELQPMRPSGGSGESSMSAPPADPPTAMTDPVPPSMIEPPEEAPGMAQTGPVVEAPAMDAEASGGPIVMSVQPLSPTIDRAAAQRSLGGLRGSLGACRGAQTENFTIQVMYAQIGGTVMSSEPHPPWDASQAATCAAGVLSGAPPIPGSYGIVRVRITLPAR
jgi:serine/threonine-protein kinase